MRIRNLLCLQFCLIWVTLQSARSESLSDLWIAEQRHPDASKLQLSEKFRNHRIVFIGGFLHEISDRMSLYWYEARREAKNLGIYSSYHTHSKSFNPAPENVEHLRDHIQSLHRKDSRKVVLIAHSKGAIEALYLLLKYPSLILSGVVDAAILVQAPVQGTPAAESKEMSRLGRNFSTIFGNSLRSLRKKQAQWSLQTALAHYKQFLNSEFSPPQSQFVHEMISKRIFYVRSVLPADPISIGLRFVHFMNWNSIEQHGPSDGLILTEDQFTPLIGTDLGILEADHLSLVLAGPISNGTASTRSAFFRALLRVLPDSWMSDSTRSRL